MVRGSGRVGCKDFLVKSAQLNGYWTGLAPVILHLFLYLYPVALLEPAPGTWHLQAEVALSRAEVQDMGPSAPTSFRTAFTAGRVRECDAEHGPERLRA